MKLLSLQIIVNKPSRKARHRLFGWKGDKLIIKLVFCYLFNQLFEVLNGEETNSMCVPWYCLLLLYECLVGVSTDGNEFLFLYLGLLVQRPSTILSRDYRITVGMNWNLSPPLRPNLPVSPYKLILITSCEKSTLNNKDDLLYRTLDCYPNMLVSRYLYEGIADKFLLIITEKFSEKRPGKSP